MAQVNDVSSSPQSSINTLRVQDQNRKPDVGSEDARSQKAVRDEGAQKLRDSQRKDQAVLERKAVSEAVRDDKERREKTEAAREPALKPPKQKVIRTRSTGIDSRPKVENNDKQDSRPVNPANIQTERGQNVDNLI
ncbi:MAG: hypothetical protein ACE5E9_11905 [Nitrospinaceae bacterium]